MQKLCIPKFSVILYCREFQSSGHLGQKGLFFQVFEQNNLEASSHVKPTANTCAPVAEKGSPVVPSCPINFGHNVQTELEFFLGKPCLRQLAFSLCEAARSPISCVPS
jgi:hypothetical protein